MIDEDALGRRPTPLHRGPSPYQSKPDRPAPDGPFPTSISKARRGLSPSGGTADLTRRHQSLVSRARTARLPSRGDESKRPYGRAQPLAGSSGCSGDSSSGPRQRAKARALTWSIEGLGALCFRRAIVEAGPSPSRSPSRRDRPSRNGIQTEIVKHCHRQRWMTREGE